MSVTIGLLYNWGRAAEKWERKLKWVIFLIFDIVDICLFALQFLKLDVFENKNLLIQFNLLSGYPEEWTNIIKSLYCFNSGVVFLKWIRTRF